MGVAGEHGGVDAVALGLLAQGAGEVAHALWVGEHDLHAVVAEALMEFAVVAAGRFHGDAPGTELAEPVAQGAAPFGGVGKAALELAGIDEDVEPVLADVNTGDGVGGRWWGRCHGLLGILSTGQGDSREPLLLECGSGPLLPFRSCGNCCGGRSSLNTVPSTQWQTRSSPPQGGEILAQPVSEHPAAPRSLSVQHKESVARAQAASSCKLHGHQADCGMTGNAWPLGRLSYKVCQTSPSLIVGSVLRPRLFGGVASLPIEGTLLRSTISDSCTNKGRELKKTCRGDPFVWLCGKAGIQAGEAMYRVGLCGLFRRRKSELSESTAAEHSFRCQWAQSPILVCSRRHPPPRTLCSSALLIAWPPRSRSTVAPAGLVMDPEFNSRPSAGILTPSGSLSEDWTR